MNSMPIKHPVAGKESRPSEDWLNRKDRRKWRAEGRIDKGQIDKIERLSFHQGLLRTCS
jgi:hypothetical protein